MYAKKTSTRKCCLEKNFKKRKMSDESRVPLFHYNDGTNEIEYGDVSVRTGANRVDVKGSTGEVLHNGAAIGGGGGGGGSSTSPYMLKLPVVRCGINVPGDPDEISQTVTRPLGPFVIDAGEGSSGAGFAKLMTVNMTTPLNYSFIFPNLSMSSNTGGNDFNAFSGFNNNRMFGMSLGRRTNYDSASGLHTFTFTIDFGAVWDGHGNSTLMVLVTIDASTADGGPPVAGPP